MRFSVGGDKLWESFYQIFQAAAQSGSQMCENKKQQKKTTEIYITSSLINLKPSTKRGFECQLKITQYSVVEG